MNRLRHPRDIQLLRSWFEPLRGFAALRSGEHGPAPGLCQLFFETALRRPNVFSVTTGYLTFIVGSPSRIHVRRTSPSLTAAFALLIASPSAIPRFANNCRHNSRFIKACSSAIVIPDDAHTATAPPGPFISASAKLPNPGSSKYPFRHVIITNTAR